MKNIYECEYWKKHQQGKFSKIIRTLLAETFSEAAKKAEVPFNEPDSMVYYELRSITLTMKEVIETKGID